MPISILVIYNNKNMFSITFCPSAVFIFNFVMSLISTKVVLGAVTREKVKCRDTQYVL